MRASEQVRVPLTLKPLAAFRRDVYDQRVKSP